MSLVSETWVMSGRLWIHRANIISNSNRRRSREQLQPVIFCSRHEADGKQQSIEQCLEASGSGPWRLVYAPFAGRSQPAPVTLEVGGGIVLRT